MTIKEIVEQYGAKSGEDEMWESITAISECAEQLKEYDECAYCQLKKKLYSIMQGKHYDYDFAMEQIGKMHYTDSRTVVHRAPYWTEDQMSEAYRMVKGSIPSCYTEYDFWVALNMLKSDYGNLIESWFPDTANDKVIEMTVSYFNDPDAQHKDSKIWSYFND